MFFFKKKCPRCDSKEIKVVKRAITIGNLLFPRIQDLWFPKKPLNVCRNCGFSWEDR